MIDNILFLPHGMQIIPGTEIDFNESFRPLHNEMLKIAEIITEKEIDRFILFTPHGYNLAKSFTLYQHSMFKGILYQLENDSVVHGEIKESYNFSSDIEFNKEIFDLLQDEILIEEIIHGVSDYPMTLNWGSFVPLYYAVNTMKTPVSILSFPRTRHTNLNELMQKIDLLVDVLFEYLQNKEESICIIVSGDLSHTHQQDGPYGYHKGSEIFDDLVQTWMEDLQDDQMNKMLTLQPNALACGMIGMYMIQKFNKYLNLELNYSFYDVPTYFGMGIAYWLPSN